MISEVLDLFTKIRLKNLICLKYLFQCYWPYRLLVLHKQSAPLYFFVPFLNMYCSRCFSMELFTFSNA